MKATIDPHKKLYDFFDQWLKEMEVQEREEQEQPEPDADADQNCFED